MNNTPRLETSCPPAARRFPACSLLGLPRALALLGLCLLLPNYLLAATVPGAPTAVLATGGNLQATVSFTAPASNGGATITGYTVTSSPAGGTDSNAGTTGLSHLVTGLTNGTSYTFTVTATNSVGSSVASSASAAVTPAFTVPGAPTGVVAVGGATQAVVSFTAPASDGGATITGYTVTSNSGGFTATGTGSPLIVTGLSHGASYTFTVKATNSIGMSLASSASPSALIGSWANNYGLSTYDASVRGTATDASGNVYIVGFYSGPTLQVVGTTLTRIGVQDGFVVKYNAGGTVVWARTYGGSGASVLLETVAVDSSGNVFVGGTFRNGSLTTPALTLIGSKDAFALKLSSSGGTTWSKNFGGAAASLTADHMALDRAGYLYLSGQFTANLTTPAVTLIGTCDAYVLKLTAGAGTTEWVKNFGGSGANTTAAGLAVDGSGHILVGGYFNSANLTTPALTKIGTTDAFALQLSAGNGATTWAKNFGGSGATLYATDIAADSLGNAYLVGQLSGANPTTPALTKIGTGDAFALKLAAADGTTTWAKNFGGSGSSIYNGQKIAVDQADSVYLCGSMWGSLTTPALPSKGGTSDAFALKLDATGAITWSKNYGGSGTTTAYGYAVAVDRAGNLWLGGYLGNGNVLMTAPVPTLTAIGGNNCWDAILIKESTVTPALLAPSVPGAPTAVSASGGNARAVVSFTPPVNNGAVITSCTATSSPGGFTATGASSPLTVTGLTNGTSYTFTVTAANSAGTGAASAASSAVTPTLAAPDAPTAIIALGGNKIATVSFTAPANDGGAAITGYTVTATPVGGGAAITETGASSPLVVSGLTNLASYTFTVTATSSLGTSSISSATPETVIGGWAQSYGYLSTNAYAKKVAIDAAGNVYLAGYYDSLTLTLGSVTLTRLGDQSGFACKINPSGTVLWAKNFGGSGTNKTYISSIAVDSAGNAYLWGYYDLAKLTTPDLTMIGFRDAFLLKLAAADGATIWAKNFGGTGASTVSLEITLNSADNIYLSGFFNTASMTTPALTKIGNNDTFVLKLAADGTTLWSQNFGGSGANVNAYGIAADDSGNVYLGGYFYNGNLTTPALAKIGDTDTFVLKLAADGAIMWKQNFGGALAKTFCYSLALDGLGSCYLTGFYQGIGGIGADLTTPTLPKIGNADAFLLKLATADGAITWAQNYGGAAADTVSNQVKVDRNGTVYLTGRFLTNRLSKPALNQIGMMDGFMMKVAPADGAVINAMGYNGAGSSVRADSVGVDSMGNVYVCGQLSSANMTNPALSVIGNTTAMLIKQPYPFPPGPPTGVTATAGNAEVVVSFTPPTNNGGLAITGYTVTANSGGFTATGAGSPLTVTGLTNGQAKTFTVVATNDVGSSLVSAASASVTPATVPGAPTITTTTKGNTQVTVAFTAPASTGGAAITGYTVTASPAGGTDSNAGTTGLSHIVTGLTNGTSYTFTVTATNRIGAGAASATSAAVTPSTVPGAPTSVTVVGGDAQAAVTFTAPASDGGAAITVYTVTATPVGGGSAITATGASSPITATGLTNGTSYTFAVKATTSVGTGSSGAAGSALTPATVPGATTGVTATGGNAQATVTFTAPASTGGAAITAYTVTATPVAGGSAITATGASSPIAVTGLTNLASYTFTITATNSVGTSAASSASPETVIGDWAKNFGLSTKAAYVYGTATDAAGNVYIAGHFNGATFAVGGVTLTKLGSTDAFAAKFNAAGAVVWAQSLGGSGAWTMSRGLAVDSAGNVYLGGYFGGASLTTPACTLVGYEDSMVVKFAAADGAISWIQRFGVSSSTYVYGLATDSAGNVFIAGYFDGPTLVLGGVTLNKLGSQSAFAAKLSAAGAVQWAQKFGGSGAYVYGLGIAVDGAGNAYLGGYFQSADLTVPALTRLGSSDTFAVKLAGADGATTWAQRFGGSGASAYGSCIAVDSAGSVYLGGYFQTANLTTPALTKLGVQDAFALKLAAADGTLTWGKNFGGSGASVRGSAIAADRVGNVYLDGYFDTANLTTPALTKLGAQDAFALQLDSSGNPTWAKSYGGSGVSATGAAIATDSACNVYVGGYFQGANPTSPALTLLGSNDALLLKQTYPFPPGAPTGVAASAGDGQATVTFTAPANTGGAAITGYTVTSSPGGFTATGASSPLTVTGLTNGTSYTFTVTATTSAGTSTASGASAAVTAGAPGAPTAVLAIGGNQQGTVSFTAPASNGGATITGYTVTATPVGGGAAITATGASSPVAVTGLTNLASYTFTVAATNANSTGPVSGATPETLIGDWARSYGLAASTSYANATATDAAGNVYLAGYFDGATLAIGGVTLTKIGTKDAYACKLTPSGTVAWAKNFGGAGAMTNGLALAVDSAGNVYLGVNRVGASLTTPVLANIGTQDAIALKLAAADGATLWAKNFGGSGASTQCQGIAVDSAGGVYLSGYFDTASLTTPALTRIGSTDAFALKLAAADGTTTWAKNFGGSGALATSSGIAADGAGNVYLCGRFTAASLTTPALTKIGTSDAYALKLAAADGATTWAKNFGGANAAVFGQGITVDNAGGVYLGGSFMTASLTTPSLTKIGYSDAFALKLAAADGTTTWAKNFGGSGGAAAYAYGIAADGAGNVYLGGLFYISNLTTPALTMIGQLDVLALKLAAADGTVAKAKNYGGTGGAAARAIAIAADRTGNIYLGGFFYTGNLTTPALTKIGDSDMLLIKLAAPFPPGSPTGVTVEGGNAQATVSFTAPASNGGAAITGYTVTSSPGGFTATGAGSPLTVTGLTNGTSYTFTVTATNFIGTGVASAASAAVAPATVAGAPTGVTAVKGNAQAVVSFTAPASNGGAAVTGYTVTATPVGGGSAITATGASSPVTVTGLANGTSYTFAVTATNSAGTGSASSASSAVTPTTTPGAPTSVAVTGGNTQATVTFTAPASNGGATITSYTVTATPVGGGSAITRTGSGSPITVTGLTNGTSYTFTVKATNSAGNGTTGAAGSPLAPATVPGAPTSVTAVGGDAQATVSFTAPASNGGAAITGYTVTATPVGGGTAITATGASSPITVTGLTNGTSYTFAVTATNSTGTGSGGAAGSALTPVTVPGAPTSVAAEIGNTQAVVTFTAPASNGGATITGYTVTATPVGGGTAITATGASSPITVTGLANGTSYDFTVTATNSAGTGSGGSNGSPLTPTTVPGAPTAVTAVGGNAQATVSFTAPASNGGAAITGYTVTATPVGGGTAITATGASSPITVTGLANGTSYTFAVTATNSTGTGSGGAAGSALTPVTVPGVPADVAVTSGNMQATVAFTPPASSGGATVTGYTVTATPVGGGTAVTATGASSPITVTGLANGTSYDFTVTATNSVGTGTVTAPITVMVSKRAQTITFDTLADRLGNSGTFTLGATASSGLPVSYRIVSGPALLAGADVSLTGIAGTVVIAATQTGNAVYAAAPEVTVSFIVSAAKTNVYFGTVTSAGTNAKAGDISAAIPPNSHQGSLLVVAPGVGLNAAFSFTLTADGTFVLTYDPPGVTGTSTGPRALDLAGSPRSTATAVTLTIRGSLINGVLQGVIEPLGLTFNAPVLPVDGPSASAAGFYQSSSLAMASGTTYSMIGTNSQVMVLATTPAVTVGGLTTLDTHGGFSLQTPTGTVTATIRGQVDVATTTVSGSVSLPGAAPTTFAGLVSTTTRTDRLINLSTRGQVGAGRTLITGFVVGGATPKRVLLRAVGPTLANFGVGQALVNPQLKLFDATGQVIAQNDDWSGADTFATTTQVGAFALATGTKDAALLATLAPGVYTMHVGDHGGTGVAIAEIYDASNNPNADYQRLINMSSRGEVGSGEDMLICGFIITGNSPKRVLVRAVGPGLTPFGVTGALADPRLRVFAGSTLIGENDNWSAVPADAATTAQAAAATGAFALMTGSKDAAFVITLMPGAYTGQVSSADGTSTGNALVEIYELP